MSAAKKICVLGMFGAGKTSLVDRVAFDRFSADYKTTIGVRPVPATLGEGIASPQRVVLWDIAGESEVSRLTRTYLTGAHAFAIVMDGMRGESVEAARRIVRACEVEYPHVPYVLLLNKADISGAWDVNFEAAQSHFSQSLFRVSAKEGSGVREAFTKVLREP